MPRLLLSTCLLIWCNTAGFAQTFSVELETVVFDRDLSEAEIKAIHDTKHAIPHGSGYYAKSSLDLLRKNATQLARHHTAVTLRQTEYSSTKLESDHMKTEAHIRVLESNSEACHLDIQWGAAYVLNDKQLHISKHTEKRWVPFGEERPISGGGGEKFYLQFVISARRATNDDVAPKELPLDFGMDLQKRIMPMPLKDALIKP